MKTRGWDSGRDMCARPWARKGKVVGLCGMPATGVVVLMMGKVWKIELRMRWQ